MSQSLFSQPLNVINVGIAMFSDDLKKQHVEVTQLDWTPPGQGNMQVVQALDNIADSPLADKIAAANQQALERIIQSHPVLIGFDQAINVVPGMTAKTILHAGPPITWEKMCGAMKGAVTGALVFEGLAKDLDEAAELAASGDHLLAVSRARLRGIDGGCYLGLDVYAHRKNKPTATSLIPT